jgi:hypothetical protein
MSLISAAYMAKPMPIRKTNSNKTRNTTTWRFEVSFFTALPLVFKDCQAKEKVFQGIKESGQLHRGTTSQEVSSSKINQIPLPNQPVPYSRHQPRKHPMLTRAAKVNTQAVPEPFGTRWSAKSPTTPIATDKLISETDSRPHTIFRLVPSISRPPQDLYPLV